MDYARALRSSTKRIVGSGYEIARTLDRYLRLIQINNSIKT